MKKYTMSLKRRIRDLQQIDIDKGIEVLTLRNQGWTFESIGTSLGMTRQGANKLYKYMLGMSVEEAELIRQCLSKLPVDNRE
jgi:transcriptional regulator